MTSMNSPRYVPNVQYQFVYFSPRPWLEEKFLVAVEEFSDNDVITRYPTSVSHWQSVLSPETWNCMLVCAIYADSPHVTRSEVGFCHVDMWKKFLNDMLSPPEFLHK